MFLKNFNLVLDENFSYFFRRFPRVVRGANKHYALFG